ncbi:fibronectin type III domain-containing protein [Methylocella sp.]|uniref:fibronectin type III domain-containing protein n=1 Tax=Methylocella sp. TaxID=1978226 RepID=UPI003C7251DB
MKLAPATLLAAASALMSSVGAPASALACAAPWSASAIYTAGGQASENGIVYRANWWTQNQDPAANNGGAGSGEPWTKVGSCSSCAAPPPTPKGLSASGTTSSATTLTWTAVTVPACTVTGYDVYENGALIGNPAGSSFAVSGLTPKTAYVFTVAAVDSADASAKSAPLAVTTASAGGGGGASSGAINFHLLIGAGPAADTLALTGGNYDDLIMSNIIAGVMYGHIVEEGYPGIRFNKDYLIGSIFAQLLQENTATYYYQAGDNRIDPSPNQQAVMGAGQGGPYQINNYAVDLVAGSYAPQGHSLINYVAIQKNIGFTMANAASQYAKPTPPSFNNKYYGPMLTAFFHYNDMVALSVTGKGANGWPPPGSRPMTKPSRISSTCRTVSSTSF